MHQGDDIYQRTFNFSIKILAFSNKISSSLINKILLSQLVRSGCSIGANLREAKQSRTRKEFSNKFSIALQEAEETDYWLSIVSKIDLKMKQDCDKLLQECKEIKKILATIIIKSKKK